MSRNPMGSDGGAIFFDPLVSGTHAVVPQGISADMIATLEGFNRGELDQFAVHSHQKAAHARDNGYFQRSLLPVHDMNGALVLDHDETIRPDCNAETLGKLRPSFERLGQMGFDETARRRYPTLEHIDHVHHAGNSSGIVDGSALLLIGSEEKGRALGLKPRARIRWACSVSSRAAAGKPSS